MNKTPEEAWELIKTVADANQHFNRRASSKGVYEVAPSDSTGRRDDSQQKPVRHCGICSCNSHHTDECLQLQEDNEVVSTHNFYDATTNPPYNSQPQNGQNPRYHPPHNRQQYSPSNNPPFNFDEAIRIVQKENQEMREAQKRTEAQLSHLTEMLQRIINQPTVSPQSQTQPSSPLPSQLLPNPKGGINAVQVEEEEDEIEDKDDENDWLYELLKKLANSDDEEDEEIEDESKEEDEDESTKEGSEDEFVEEGDQTEEEAREENRDKGKFFS
ncbi:hypothetical protein PIB30_101850 [Stylosanthes scabra]|uniref:Uncharacterized protein n=1 Tax=Stylosanthes scabra TaxID=79078 RepID=A0ABU6RYC0_9FABA|nr:hypothetical protein [Stylosanthes scabra]